MKLLPNEENLFTSTAGNLILTSHRIQMTDRAWGQSFTISIFLEDISSIEIKYKSHIFLLILGAIFFIGSLLSVGEAGSGIMAVGLIQSLIFLAIWWFTRKNVISISSDGGASLNFKVQGVDDEDINDFVYKVSLAKQIRVNQLCKL